MKLNPSIKNMSNEYIFFTDQTALTFRICLVYEFVSLHNVHNNLLLLTFNYTGKTNFNFSQ
jgi:hypothetical protein